MNDSKTFKTCLKKKKGQQKSPNLTLLAFEPTLATLPPHDL